MTADTKAERLTTVFPGQDKRSVFEPDRVVIERADGTPVETRDDPEASFAGQQLDTPWDDIHVAYFSGEALWTYLNTPFLYARDDCATEEIAPVEVGGETWRRLKVTFPDYTVDILGGGTGLNYATNYQDIEGIIFPTTRRVYAYTGDYQLVPEPVLVAIDITDVRLGK
jgi:hypothetical protein